MSKLNLQTVNIWKKKQTTTEIICEAILISHVNMQTSYLRLGLQ